MPKIEQVKIITVKNFKLIFMKYAGVLLIWLLVIFNAQAQLNNLRINQVQVIGSHNSYKQAIDARLFKFMSQFDSSALSELDYSHITLTKQLNLGLCNLEIDVFSDTAGGRYAHPKGLDWVRKQAAFDQAGVMKEPGFKVFHIPEYDFRSNCATFKICLLELKRWSDLHRNHPPIFITMNVKDDPLNAKDYPAEAANFTIPEVFTPAIYDLLDKEIIDYLGKGNCIIPDEVRGNYPTLEEAVLAGNWPTMQQAAGKFIFILDETGDKIAAYSQHHPSLKNRMLFANAEPGKPEAAILIRNSPKSDNITELVKKGYIVRTRADADTKEARENDRSFFDAACKSGAQIITTDYYQKSTHFASPYIISFEKNTYLRKNAVTVTLYKVKEK
jgi:hypothetical protein